MTDADAGYYRSLGKYISGPYVSINDCQIACRAPVTKPVVTPSGTGWYCLNPKAYPNQWTCRQLTAVAVADLADHGYNWAGPWPTEKECQAGCGLVVSPPVSPPPPPIPVPIMPIPPRPSPPPPPVSPPPAPVSPPPAPAGCGPTECPKPVLPDCESAIARLRKIAKAPLLARLATPCSKSPMDEMTDFERTYTHLETYEGGVFPTGGGPWQLLAETNSARVAIFFRSGSGAIDTMLTTNNTDDNTDDSLPWGYHLDPMGSLGTDMLVFRQATDGPLCQGEWWFRTLGGSAHSVYVVEVILQNWPH